jgi:hypothetical protein
MAAIANLSDFINRSTGGNSGTPQDISVFKAARIGGAAAQLPTAGRVQSLWRFDGMPCGGAVPPTVATAPDNTTAGAIGQASPGGGRQQWLTYVSCGGLNAGGIMIYDRLLHISGLNGTVVLPQTVGGTLTRNTGGIGNQIWIEIYSLIGTTGTTVTASYTNQAGTPGRTTAAIAFGGTALREPTRLFCLPLQAGDTGVQSVEDVTLAGTTGTAGDFGVTIMKPVLWLPVTFLGAGGDFSALSKGRGPVEIESGACLSMFWIPASAAAPEFYMNLHLIEA